MFDCSPDAVVQGHVDAYNARDVAAIVETYSPNATIEFDARPDLTIAGSEEIRAYYSRSFAETSLVIGVISREIAGDEVIDLQEAKWNGDPVVRDLRRYRLEGCRIIGVSETPIALFRAHMGAVSQ